MPAWLVEARATGLVSVCLYGDNVGPDGGLAPVCADLHERLPGVLLAVDEEGGDVTRVHYPQGSPTVGNAVLGRLDDEELTRGRPPPSVPSSPRSASVWTSLPSSTSTPHRRTRSSGSAASGPTRPWWDGTAPPGSRGCSRPVWRPAPSTSRATVTRWSTPTTASPASTSPCRCSASASSSLRRAVRAGVACVMTSHVVVSALDPDRPATFSPTRVRVLRDELGFDGVLVSDALDMAGASAGTGIPEAAVRALAAGVDLLCLGSATTSKRHADVLAAVVTAVESGRLPHERLVEASGRVRALAERHRPDRHTRESAVIPDAAVARTFATSDAVPAFVADPAHLAVVQVGSGTNLAVGAVSWGPAALGATVPAGEVPTGAKVAVVGRSIGPAHPAHTTAERLRSAGHRVVLVECGWPRGGADVETYGGSPAVARALLALLRGEVAR